MRLLYYEEFTEKSEAQRRECEIKRLSREKKLALVQGGVKDEAAVPEGKNSGKQAQGGEFSAGKRRGFR